MRYILIFLILAGQGISVSFTWSLTLEEQAFIYRQGVQNYEKNWNRWQEAGEPWGRYSVRIAADYAYTLVSAHCFFSEPTTTPISPPTLPMERLVPLLELIRTMQDRNPDSPTCGNFRWYWEQTTVQDRNAVEFVLGRLIFCKQHEDALCEPARKVLETILIPAAEALLKHTVSSDYTNIALLNSSNLILLGELYNRNDWSQEGLRRLNRFLAHTWQNGVSEFSTPVYYALNLETLAMLARGTKTPAIRQKAETLLEYFTAEIACRWFFPAQRLAGAYSRTYHYADSDPYLLYVLQCWGWEPLPQESSNITMIGILNGGYFPPSPSSILSPRLVKQQSTEGEQGSLVTFLTPQFAMGSAFLPNGCRKDDVLFAIDLPNRPRCYFFPDGRENPYGNQRFLASNNHLRAYHLQPSRFLVQQEKPWQVNLEVEYSLAKEDWQEENLTRLQSHFIFPIPDAFWLDGEKISLAEIEKKRSLNHLVLQFDQLFLHIWIQGIYPSHRSMQLFCVADSPDGRSMRLTADHGLLQEKKESCGIRNWIFLMSDQLETDWNATPASWQTYETVDFTDHGRKILEKGIPELAQYVTSTATILSIDLQPGESQTWQAWDGKFCSLFQEDDFLWCNHEIEYPLEVTQKGEYRLKALAMAETEKQNSFWYCLSPEQPFTSASFSPSSQWEWKTLPFSEQSTVPLHGSYRLKIHPREFNLRLRSLQLERIR